MITLALNKTAVTLKPKKMLLNDTCELEKRFLTIYLSKKTAKNNTLKQKLPTFHFAKNHI